jgi:hypothetical protein
MTATPREGALRPQRARAAGCHGAARTCSPPAAPGWPTPKNPDKGWPKNPPALCRASTSWFPRQERRGWPGRARTSPAMTMGKGQSPKRGCSLQ